MNINPLWFACIIVRISIIFIIRYLTQLYKKNRILFLILSSILFLMGIGFLYKGRFGSNNEIQIARVFWHETRYVHGILYILSAFYLFNENVNMASLILFTDVLFSFLYRYFFKK